MNFAEVKSVTIPEGKVAKITSGGVVLWKKVTAPKNWVLYSTEADGKTIYNGGLGCMYGYRMNSSGAVVAKAGANHTGYMPITFGDVIRAKGSTGSNVGASGNYFTLYDASFNRLFTTTMSNTTAATFYSATYTQHTDGLYMLTLDTGKAGVNVLTNTQKAAYFRISMDSCPTAGFVVTINEEMTP